MNYMENHFRENLKIFRKAGRISQQRLADALHTTVKTISHWETGYSEPSIKQILDLAEFFEISLEDLLV